MAFGGTLTIAMISETLPLVSCYIRQINKKDRDLDIPGKRVTMAKLQTLDSILEGFDCTGKSFKADGLRQHAS